MTNQKCTENIIQTSIGWILQATGDGEITTIERAIKITCDQITQGGSIGHTLGLSVLNRMVTTITLPKKLSDGKKTNYFTSLSERAVVVVIVW